MLHTGQKVEPIKMLWKIMAADVACGDCTAKMNLKSNNACVKTVRLV